MSLDTLKTHLDGCLSRFNAGTLTPADLRQALSDVDALLKSPATSARQDLLYLQAENTHLGSPALGISLVINGHCQEPPIDPEQWPYHSALDAVQDGWRVISFPNLALLVDGPTPRGFGCEFILERWRTA